MLEAKEKQMHEELAQMKIIIADLTAQVEFGNSVPVKVEEKKQQAWNFPPKQEEIKEQPVE